MDNDFARSMYELRKRKKVLEVLASKIDWSNVDREYSSYSQSLIEIQKSINLELENNGSSKAVRALAKAVTAYANLSPKNEHIIQQIQTIVDKEKETSDLYRTWKEMSDSQKVSNKSCNS